MLTKCFVCFSVLGLNRLTTGMEACCGDLGCFSTGGTFFDIVNRPFDLMPNCALAATLQLFLNTRSNPLVPQVLSISNTSTIRNSAFKASRKTIVTIHGYLDNYQNAWWKTPELQLFSLQETVKELLAEGDYNVVRLDWSAGNLLPYAQATANVRLVGAYVGRFLLHLKDQYGLAPEKMHVVGHSLGAHGAGYTGSMLKKANVTLARITGLDPAGPYFTGMGAEVRLDPGDAAFVDTIITDGEEIPYIGYGSYVAMGHINFFPNGGKKQPGCSSSLYTPGTILQGVTFNTTTFDLWGQTATAAFEGVACNHARSIALFYESINKKSCKITASECSEYQKFLRKECSDCAKSKCAVMGWNIDPALSQSSRTRKFFAKTTARSPFCNR